MLFIAHRGASGHAPENTAAAFTLALEMGARAIELDVHQTRDHELAVIHDFDLKRVSRSKLAVGALSRDELSQFDVGSWFDKRFSRERVLFLPEVFDLAEGKAELHVEIKKGSSLYAGIEERVVDLIQRRKAWGRTLVSSFDHDCLYRVRSLDSRVRIGYLLGLTPFKTGLRECRELKAESLNISLRQATAARVRDAHARGLKVLVYTVNTQKDIVRLEKAKVDGIFCNYPDLERKS